MKSIVNVNRKWGIGKNGQLLVSLPEDMKMFRETTKGKVIVLGLNTLKSFPGKRPLKGRINVVLTEELSQIPMESIEACDCYLDALTTGTGLDRLNTQGATVLIACTSPEELLDILSLFNGDDIFICGGASVYRLMLPYCDTALVTENDCEEEPDTWYPDLSADPDWEKSEEGEEKEYGGVHYRFSTYRRIRPAL